MHFPDAQIAGVRCLFESNASDNRFRFRPLLLPPLSIFLLSLSLFFSFFNQRHLLFLFRRRCFPVRELFSVCHNPPIHPLVARSRTNDRSFSISGLIIRVSSIPGEFSLSFGKMKIEVSASRDYDVYLSRGGFQARIIWHVKVFIASISLLFLRHLDTRAGYISINIYLYVTIL